MLCEVMLCDKFFCDKFFCGKMLGEMIFCDLILYIGRVRDEVIDVSVAVGEACI